jgi:hypothetical protein
MVMCGPTLLSSCCLTVRLAGNHFFIHDDQNATQFLDEVASVARQYY